MQGLPPFMHAPHRSCSPPPFILSLSKGEGGAWFDRLTTNVEGPPRSP